MTLTSLLKLFKSIFNPITQGNTRLEIYDAALNHLGVDASPNDVAPDELGCMETVDDIYCDATGHYINGSLTQVTISTYQGYQLMSNSRYFTKTDQPLEGDILVYPSGTGNGRLSNGHVFIVGAVGNNDPLNTKLMSNSSATGTFEQNYTRATAEALYEDIGGYTPHFFRAI